MPITDICVNNVFYDGVILSRMNTVSQYDTIIAIISLKIASLSNSLLPLAPPLQVAIPSSSVVRDDSFYLNSSQLRVSMRVVNLLQYLEPVQGQRQDRAESLCKVL